jgi:hypothetical protein
LRGPPASLAFDTDVHNGWGYGFNGADNGL